jgi:iron-sulfur cluster insertion protein
MTAIVQTHEPSVMQLSDVAAKKVRSLISEEGNPNLKLRVFVTGGGCSGFQYGFSFDEKTNEDDTVIANADAKLLVDALSIQYLMGSKVDYVEGLQGSRFVVENPMATTTCGCGMSFSV